MMLHIIWGMQRRYGGAACLHAVAVRGGLVMTTTAAAAAGHAAAITVALLQPDL